MASGTLVLLRHGESTFNAAQIFTGLLDTDLTPAGLAQVGIAAHLITDASITLTRVITSPMLRSRRTLDALLAALGHPDIPITTDWRLVERDYGSFTGVSKKELRRVHGEREFHELRRTMHGRPPAATPEQAATWIDPPPCPEVGPLIPGCSESLHDVVSRVAPFWQEVLEVLSAGESVLVVSHGNTLRALASIIDTLTDEEAEALNIPAGHPLVYYLTDGQTHPRGGLYLDDVAASAAAARVAAEGGT